LRVPYNGKANPKQQIPTIQEILAMQALNVPRCVELLTVTVIPLEAHMNPYPLEIQVFSDKEKNLKQVF
jgi:hypothetical protein